MTWQELERLQNLRQGSAMASQAYSYQTLEIVGTTTQRRAELELTLRLSIESTERDWVAIPLRMANFHRLAPPDVAGVEEYFMTLARDGGGYLLWVRSENRRDVSLKMRASSRVTTDSTNSLEFQLPDVPSTVRLTADVTEVQGDVIGRGYETLETNPLAGGRTEFVIESGGGDFTLRWGRLEQKGDDAPALEVNSRISVPWDSPQETPRIAVQLTVRNDRRVIDEFEITLPVGATFPDRASLGVGGQSVELRPAAGDAQTERRVVVIPEAERQQRIDLNFSYEIPLPPGGAARGSPLIFRIPEVTGAMRQRGEITLQTSDEFRLRWTAKPWVRSVLGDVAEETAAIRSYLFQYDRGSFELPLWLSAKERQVRIHATSTLSVNESSANLEMLIRSSDRAADGRGPQIDMAGWDLESITDAATGEPMDTFQGDGFPEIDYPAGPGTPPQVRLLAHHSIDSDSGPVQLTLPRVVKTEDSLLVPTSELELINTGRSLFVVDLDASTNLERMVTSGSEDAAEGTFGRFRLGTQDSPARVVGTVVEQPPRITLASDGTVTIDGERLDIAINWSVTSALDLEGVLPIRIATVSAPVTRDANADGQGPSSAVTVSDTVSADGQEAIDAWNVTVNGIRATLRATGADRYELVSDRLGSGTMAIRWTRDQPLGRRTVGDSFESLAIPRPSVDDVTVRGPVRIALRGSTDRELLTSTTPSLNEIVLDALPPDPLRLRLRTRGAPREELSIGQVVLRTAVGRSTRHEQVIAGVQGGDSFRVDLPVGVSDVSVEAFLDRSPRTVRRDGQTLFLDLPGDQASHVIDLRVWMPETTPASIATVRPALRLPVGVGRVYWQVVVPLDSHLVWASPTMGRSMTWNFAPWHLGRESSHDDRALTAMLGSSQHAMPPGNRYLYVGSDVRSFQAVAASRVVLWILVGTIVLFASVLLTHVPRTRHPLTAVVGALLFAGLLVVAPDAAVLAGQLSVIALVLVIVMIAVRALVTPQRSDRVLATRESRRRGEASTQALSPALTPDRQSSVSQTKTAAPSPTEAPS